MAKLVQEIERIAEGLVIPKHYRYQCYGGSTTIRVDVWGSEEVYECPHVGKEDWSVIEGNTHICRDCDGKLPGFLDLTDCERSRNRGVKDTVEAVLEFLDAEESQTFEVIDEGKVLYTVRYKSLEAWVSLLDRVVIFAQRSREDSAQLTRWSRAHEIQDFASLGLALPALRDILELHTRYGGEFNFSTKGSYGITLGLDVVLEECPALAALVRKEGKQ